MIGKRASWALVAILMLSFALRLLYIERQSLRGDEALSVVYAQEPLGRIVEITRSVSGHPPLFYTLLHFWQRLAGTSELAVRSFSLWWGVLAVALVYAFGRALFGPRPGAWAAGLMAINPFWVMHAQDIRVYTMLAALALTSSYLFWRAVACPRQGKCWVWWALYVLSSTCVVYAHYFGAFLILAHALFFAVVRLRQPRRWWPAVLSYGAIGAALLPWLWYARAVVTGEHLWHRLLARAVGRAGPGGCVGPASCVGGVAGRPPLTAQQWAGWPAHRRPTCADVCALALAASLPRTLPRCQRACV